MNLLSPTDLILWMYLLIPVLPAPEGSTAQRMLECTSRNLAPEEHWYTCGLGSVGPHDSVGYAHALVELVRICTAQAQAQIREHENY
jgi:hypothetical protein